MLNIITFIFKLLFGCSASGNLIVSSSISKVDIQTGWTPKQVYINLDGECGTPVCGAHHDWFDVKIVNNGFVIQCNIKSSFRKVSWLAIK